MRKKAFIFDIDGTLVNAYPAIIDSFNYTMRKIGYPEERPDVIRRAVGWGDARLLGFFVAPQHLNTALEIYRKHHAKSLPKKALLMPYSRSLLSCLRSKGLKLCVASNRPTYFTDLVLKSLKIFDLFDHILCADKLKFGKPNPLMLNTLARKMGLKKEFICYVGDMVIDVETGKRAGIDTIAVATGSSSIKELKKAKPVRVFKNLRNLKTACLHMACDKGCPNS
ncbi:MAG TPA: HAD family hydrolase [Candidatus Omnitrophota bacterium]|nr:HAD family hydrolase [Candidatus Omnitrophota bacterium]